MLKPIKPELISPAGDLEKLKIAFQYGADAVYASTPKFSMRTREIGFSEKTLKEGIGHAHKLGKKVYLTVNTFPSPYQIDEIKDHIKKSAMLNPDAFIAADPGVVEFIQQETNIPIHLSTQANTTNQLAAEFWKKQGVERIVLARELSLKDIKLISDQFAISHSEDSPSIPGMQLEAFVQGAMCMAYSGRCQISNYMTGRDPNKGACIQACRFKYRMYGLEENMRKGEIFPIYEDDNSTHILNSKDLCMIEHIPELIDAGISSFKLEGRLKSIYYVGAVTRAYRKAIDRYFENPAEYECEKSKLKKELEKVSNRGFTTGFFFHKPNQKTNNYKTSRAKSNWGFVGVVKGYDKEKKIAEIEVRNYLPAGSKIEFITPKEIISYKISSMTKKRTPVEVAHAGNIIELIVNKYLPDGTFLRSRK